MKKINYAFIIVYMLILLIPALTMPFFFNAQNTENRKLAEFPKITKEDHINADFIDEFDDFINDRIGMRSILVSLNTKLRTGVFRESTEDSVILGKKGWLFYSDTLPDYMGVATLSDRNINNIANTLKIVNEELDNQDVDFVFVIIPNKNSIYPEYMPSYYIPSGGDNNRILLQRAMDSKGVNYSDVYGALKHNNEILYQQTDSHWNYEGALIGYNKIMKDSNHPYLEINNMEFETVRDWDGDLGTMLYSVDAKKDYQLYPKYEFTYEYTSHDKEPDSITLKTHGNMVENDNAIIYRDSFMNIGHKYFAEVFTDCVFSRALPYKLDLVKDNDADFVLIEIVERNIKNLATKAPIMQAPIADASLDKAQISEDQYNLYIDEIKGYSHIYGDIDESLLGDDNNVYVYYTFKGNTQTKNLSMKKGDKETVYFDEEIANEIGNENRNQNIKYY